MKLNPEPPPAEVRPSSSLNELRGEVRAMWSDHVRTNLDQAREIGIKLRAAKALCVKQNRSWLAWLAESGVSRITAWKYMRLAEKWPLLVDYVSWAKQPTIDGAIRFLAGGRGDEEEDEIFSQDAPPRSAAGMAPPPVRPATLCPRCERKGFQVGCEDCKRLNSGKAASAPKPPPVDWEREPGDDDGDVDEAYARYEASRLRAVSGPLIREIRLIAAAHGLKAPAPKRPWQPSLPFEEWFHEFDPRFHPVMRKLWDARKTLAKVLTELEEQRARGGRKGEEGLPE